MQDLKILILEDNESDADLLHRELKKSGLQFTSELVQTRTAFEKALESCTPDLILSDYALPAFDAVTAFHIKQKLHAHIPFIIVSGVIGEENAVELIKSGVTDYVSKSKLFTLSTKINRALNDMQARKEKLLTEEKLKSLNLELLELNQELELRVTKRTKALADSESRFRSMMETIPEIAWTNTLKGEVVFYNRRWHDYTGMDELQTRSKGLKFFLHPEDSKQALSTFRSILTDHKGGEFQVRILRADKLYRWHLVRLMPIMNDQDQTNLWVGSATDIQELRLIQQYKDDYIIIASHELKTPITSLKASIQMLDRIKAQQPSQTSFKLIAQANRSLDKVNGLMEDLLNASMASQGQLNINRQHFMLSEVIQSCCTDLNPESGFTIKIEAEKPIKVFADILRIEQVITNFITNATKYAPESKEIRIKIEQIACMAKISVIDSGPGIPPGKIAFLFDRYYRADTSGTQYAGLGLGLYICAEIIKKHGGQIGAESTLNEGSCFWFSLPMAEQPYAKPSLINSSA